MAGRLLIVEVAGCDSDRRGKVRKCSCLLSPFTPVSLERGLPRSELGLVKKMSKLHSIGSKKRPTKYFLRTVQFREKIDWGVFSKVCFL